MNFCGKVVLLTGAGSGIGAATAIKFAELGANLIMSGQSSKKLEEVAQACSKVGNCPEIIIGNLAKPEGVKKVWEEALQINSKMDILVNNAGLLEMGSIENTSLEQLDRVMNVNLKAAYYLTMLAVPELIKVKGNIVNVSSINGLRSFPGLLAYNISKAAITQLTRCVALELGPKGVRVNCVNPGIIVTNLHTAGGMNTEEYKKFIEHSKTTHILGRVGKPEEVANGIIYLASDLSSFNTGVSLSIDGGRNVMCPR